MASEWNVVNVQSNAVQEFMGVDNSGPIPEMVPLSRWLVSGML